MDKQELRQQLRAVFIDELHECAGDMHRHLMSLQKNPEPPVCEMLIHELYRAAHKMKGAAISAEVPAIEKLCRRMQEILTSVRDSHQIFDDKLRAQFLDAVSFLSAAEAKLRVGTTLESEDSIFD